jgi:hypothetical protein
VQAEPKFIFQHGHAMRRRAMWLMTNLVEPLIFIAIVMLMVPLALMVA